MQRSQRRLGLTLAPGIIAFLIAVLSVADMFLPRPYDGVILEADVPGARVVRAVVPGSGAERAGIRPGDVIVGIDRTFLDSQTHAQTLLNRHRIGDSISYLVRSSGSIFEIEVELGRRRIGDTSYLYAALLGFLFFGVGLFVVLRQPRLPAARVFFIMCSLFMLFLVCRLRPASYSWVDTFVLSFGTIALLFLPAAFLHFFLIYPRPVWEWRRDPLARLVGWVSKISAKMLPIYLLPPLVYLGTMLWARRSDHPLGLISGAPMSNWWAMVGYMVLGLGALGTSARYLPDANQRRGAGLVFLGTLFGVVPFIVLAVAFPSFFNTERYLFFGVVPLILVPITFAYAIIRFGLLDIRVILRKSLLYTVTTAMVTAVYALGIASFNLLFRGTALAASPYFPVIFALAIVLLFEPLRQRLQGPVDRFFFAERLRLQHAMVEMGEAFTREVEIGPAIEINPIQIRLRGEGQRDLDRPVRPVTDGCERGGIRRRLPDLPRGLGVGVVHRIENLLIAGRGKTQNANQRQQTGRHDGVSSGKSGVGCRRSEAAGHGRRPDCGSPSREDRRHAGHRVDDEHGPAGDAKAAVLGFVGG